MSTFAQSHNSLLRAGRAVGVACALVSAVGWLLAAAGAVALIPVGIYLAGVPGPMRFVGYAAVGYLVAAALMYAGRERGSQQRVGRGRLW
jgi:hypothetical protein